MKRCGTLLNRGLQLKPTDRLRQQARVASKWSSRESVEEGRISAIYWSITEQNTRNLAEQLCARRTTGDCICLFGEVGSGKSAFSRAYIQAAEGDDEFPVPSPTYLLHNSYEFEEGADVHHFDLYRLGGKDELGRLDLHSCLTSGITLIEWAERLENDAPTNRLDIHIGIVEEDKRQAALRSGLVSEPTAAIEDDEGEEMYTDKGWREIRLQPHGKHWESVVSEISADESGLVHVTTELTSALRSHDSQT